MELFRYISPEYDPRVIGLWAEVFGPEEARMEEIQLSGTEAQENTDILLLARDGDALLGAVHATIPKRNPALCGVSGFCTTPEARGRGVGRFLFRELQEELGRRGVTASVLGTNNPIAAKLYASQGFRYLPGSNVMARYLRGDTVDYVRDRYLTEPEQTYVLHNSPGIRIPMIPLIVLARDQLLLDCNAGIFCSDIVTQRSCMGLYPKYEAVAAGGGDFYGCFGRDGTLGALATSMPTPEGLRVDFLACEGYWCVIPRFLREIGVLQADTYFQLSREDPGKAAIVRELGYTPRENRPYSLDSLTVMTAVYRPQ